jgi:hypothetical protein
LILVLPSRLLRTPPTWRASLFLEHTTALLTQCLESITGIFFPNVFLVNDEMLLSCF